MARSGGIFWGAPPCKPMWAPLGLLWGASWRGLAGYSGAPHPANQCGRLWGASGAPLGRFGEVWRRSPGNSGRTWRETLNPKLRGAPGEPQVAVLRVGSPRGAPGRSSTRGGGLQVAVQLVEGARGIYPGFRVLFILYSKQAPARRQLPHGLETAEQLQATGSTACLGPNTSTGVSAQYWRPALRLQLGLTLPP